MPRRSRTRARTDAARRSHLRTFTLTEAEYLRALADMDGRCLACGDTAGPVEPDARQDRCPRCGAREVYGIEELLTMERITLRERGETP